MYLIWFTLCSDHLILLSQDHPEIIRDSISECVPILGQGLFKETKNCFREGLKGVVVFIMGNSLMHESPKALNSIEVRCIGR